MEPDQHQRDSRGAPGEPATSARSSTSPASWTGAAPVALLDNLTVGPDSGPPVNVPPTASFTASPEYLTAWFDATTSTDPDDGTITNYSVELR